MATTQEKTQSPADRNYGYSFGVDGLIDYAGVAKFLGVSKSTVKRIAGLGRLRVGTAAPGTKSFVCKRSLQEYVSTIEN